MILADVGNTSIHFGVVDKKRIRDIRLPAQKASVPAINKIVREFPDRELVICSVVPKITAMFKKLKRKCRIVGRDLSVPIKSLYNKKQLGQDRLLSAFAGRRLYPRARLIIDFGTAITFDFITAKGEYAGGFIFPGIDLSYKALSSCALLPDKIDSLDHRLAKIPTNTCDSIHKGIREGSALTVNAWVKKYKNWISPRSDLSKGKVILTGGQALYVLPYLDFPYIYEPQLLFKGMILAMDAEK